MVKKLPNYITALRLLLIPIFVALMHEPGTLALYAATAIFVLAALTDILDGQIARRFRATSDVGRLLDPLADKLLVMAALVMLVAQRGDLDAAPWVPAWMVVLILAREIWVTGLRGIAASRGIIIAAGNTGKWKSALQMVAIVFLLLHSPRVEILGYPVTFQFVGLYLLLVSIFLSYWGAVDYTFSLFRSGFSEHSTPEDDPD